MSPGAARYHQLSILPRSLAISLPPRCAFERMPAPPEATRPHELCISCSLDTASLHRRHAKHAAARERRKSTLNGVVSCAPLLRLHDWRAFASDAIARSEASLRACVGATVACVVGAPVFIGSAAQYARRPASISQNREFASRLCVSCAIAYAMRAPSLRCYCTSESVALQLRESFSCLRNATSAVQHRCRCSRCACLVGLRATPCS